MTATVAIMLEGAPIAVSGNSELIAQVASRMLESARQQQLHERTVRRTLRQLSQSKTSK